MVVGLSAFNNIKDHGDALVLATVITRRFHGSPDCQNPGFAQAYIPLTFGGEVELLFFFSFVFCHGGIIGDGVWAESVFITAAQPPRVRQITVQEYPHWYCKLAMLNLFPHYPAGSSQFALLI